MANDLTQHTLHLSDYRLEIESDCVPVNKVIARTWDAGRRPILAPTKTHRIGVYTADALKLTIDGEPVWSRPLDDAPADTFELMLYRRMLAEHESRFGMFHAAAVGGPGITWVLCGASGAGKSSLAVTALMRGYHYYTDEFVVTDGHLVWGWPRAPQFDPSSHPGAELPEWLTELDPPDEDATHRYSVPRHQVARCPAPAEQVHFVYIARGARTRLEPVGVTEALQLWTEAAFYDSPVSLGAIVSRARSWRAVWRHPGELWQALEQATQGKPREGRIPARLRSD